MARQYNLKPPTENVEQPRPTDLQDDSPFPFGKHKDVPMKEVPVSYIAWAWQTFVHKQFGSPLFRYVVKNVEALESDDSDVIFDPEPRKFKSAVK